MRSRSLMTGVFECSLAGGELLTGIEVPRLSSGARWGYYKHCRKTGELAHAIGAYLHDPDRSLCRAVIGATGSRPIVFTDATALFGGSAPGSAIDRGFVERAMTAHGMTDPIDAADPLCLPAAGDRASSIAHDHSLPHHQRACGQRGGRAAHASGGFHPRDADADRNASRLRAWRLRRLHRAGRRRAGALLHHLRGGLQWRERDHHRRPRRRRDRQGAARRLHARARLAVRLLHARHADLGARSGAAGADSDPSRISASR